MAAWSKGRIIGGDINEHDGGCDQAPDESFKEMNVCKAKKKPIPSSTKSSLPGCAVALMVCIFNQIALFYFSLMMSNT